MRNAVILALSLFLLAGAAPKAPVTTADLDDPAGDVKAAQTSDGTRAPFDVVHLKLTSDGTNILVAATLKDPPGAFASAVVKLHFDTDNNTATGVKMFFGEKKGFEAVSELNACVDYTNGGSACAGSLSGSGVKVKSHFAVADLNKFGSSASEKTKLVASFDAAKSPIDAKVVQGSIAYAKLGVKPGQVIRIVATESDAGFDESADFPDILLKLK